MALSKSTRIIILLVIDSIFFLIELITGYAVHSLALVADSFHMLNDVLSLCVGLWAVKVANSKTNSKMYTYGWQRAETLGALVNGVFLVALCVTIFLDAIQRFVEPQVVSNPKLVLIVGCLGLGSNILGLFLFHDHSHGPGGHSHGEEGHSHGDETIHAEEGHAHGHIAENEQRRVADESGNIINVLPQESLGAWPGSQSRVATDELVSAKRHTKRKHSRSGSRFSDANEVPVNPRDLRRSIIDASLMGQIDSEEEAVSVADDGAVSPHGDSNKAPLLSGDSQGYGSIRRKSIDHKQHKHRQPKEAGNGHGHSHGDLNMRGIFLHVMGDALGNIGVIATALIIWLTKWPGRYYFDPAISLVITVIILCSAIPLCKAASRILLQAVPYGISVDDIKEDIIDLPGIISCHHLHVWQLSDTKLVASLHVQVDYDFKGEGSARYMKLAQAIRQCLHEYGIHSVTIQPEFCVNPEHDHSGDLPTELAGGSGASSTAAARRSSRQGSKASSVHGENACLLECNENCGNGKNCCAPSSRKGSQTHGHTH